MSHPTIVLVHIEDDNLATIIGYSINSNSRGRAVHLKVPILPMNRLGVNMMAHDGISLYSVSFFKNLLNYTKTMSMLKEH